MSPLSECLTLPSGAQFYRADLHVHSYNASHDIRDETMTPEAVVATAISEGLHVIAIADHNEIGGVQPALRAAEGKGLYIVPAVELSTSEAHLLCYLPNFEALQTFYARLKIADKGKGTSRCQTAILECLGLLDEFAGFGVLAHVEVPSGFEHDHPTNTPHKMDVLCHKALLGIELKSANCNVSYSDSDPEPLRRQCGAERTARLGLATKQYLARVVNSDAHSLKALGHNAAGLKKVSRIKMHVPSFGGLRIAFEDSDARIRIEDEIPTSVSRILGVSIDGGFLDGQKIHFSPNLNCIIGGRGTGKSTLFEAVRCLSGEKSSTGHLDSDVWPREMWLFWQDAAGQHHTLYRPHGADIVNADDPMEGPTAFPIESYGQAETAQISKEAQKDPGALLGYLDRFVDTNDARAAERQAIQALKEIHQQLEAAEKQIALIPEYEKALQQVRSQLAASEKANAKELITLQRHLAEEQQLRKEILTSLAEIKEQLTSFSPKQSVDMFAQLADASKLALGRAEFEAIVKSAREFESSATASLGTTATSFEAFKQAVSAKLKEWTSKEAESAKTLEAKRRELEKTGVRLDMNFIESLAKAEAKYNADLTRLKVVRQKRIEQEKTRRKVLAERWAARDRITATRVAYAIEASERLRVGLTDLYVSLKFSENAYAPEAADIIQQAMGWRTVQVPRAPLLIERLTVRGLLEAVDKNNVDAIAAIENDAGQRIISKEDAAGLVTKLSELPTRYALERCEIFDLPRLTVARKIVEAAGPRYVKRDFAKLSLGQQQSVLLALMLSSNNNNPLIIDQPEDNLDGEFIYRSVVPVLRLAKERRQIIVVTHNPNITVLGDAEQIISLKSTADKGSIAARGSIDDQGVRDSACVILEGARDAFQRRARIYGILK
jgi:energy-coupling factor transporter ATP-binding protein EcfA2